jgi:protein O-GlcNAc transferase
MKNVENNKAIEDQIAFCINAIASAPDRAFPYIRLAALRFRSGQMFAAKALCEQATTICPTYAEAWSLKGRVAEGLGDKAAAIDSYRHAVTLAPKFQEPYQRLRSYVGRAELEGLVAKCWPIPDHYEATPDWTLDESTDESTLRSLINQEGFSPKRLIKLALILQSESRMVEAECLARYVLEADAKNSNALLLLSSLSRTVGDHDAAATFAMRALDATPSHPVAATVAISAALNVCAWDRYDYLLERAKAAIATYPGTAEPVDALLYLSDPRSQASVARAVACKQSGPIVQAGKTNETPWIRPAKEDSRITIGYLSADFHAHPIGRLMAELVRHHSHDQFIFRAYSTWPAPENEFRSSIIQNCDSFEEIYGLDAITAAKKISDDAVDILVDLSGHTLNGRVDILAKQAAPIQVGFAGYLGTLGLPSVQYQIVDAVVGSNPEALALDESLVRLPFSMLAGDRHRFAKPMPPVARSDVGLPSNGTVYCNFSLPNRVNPMMFDLWSRILQRVPDSVLWLVQSGSEAAQRIRARAVTNGLSANRIIFSERVAYDEYLQRFACADLFLDTLPQNAGAVANDALWMGCPVLTCSDDVLQSRIGAGMVRAAGIPELALSSLEAYEEMAVRLGKSQPELNELRRRLIAGRDTQPMFNSQMMVKHLEWAFRAIWQRHLDGETPAMIDVPRIF